MHLTIFGYNEEIISQFNVHEYLYGYFRFFTAKICPYHLLFDAGPIGQPVPDGLPGAPPPMPTLMPAPSIPGKYKMRIYYR